MKGTENETVQCLCESGSTLKLRNQKLHTRDMYVVNKSKRDEEITEIERCLQQSHKEGLF